MAVGNALHSSRKAPNIALVAPHWARSPGSNEFLRICAAGLWQKQHNAALKFSVFVPDGSRFQTLRRHLAPWKRGLRSRHRDDSLDGSALPLFNIRGAKGPIEGHVHPSKPINRSMYGRAKFDLLRLRVVNAE
jgi:hypothetical protein